MNTLSHNVKTLRTNLDWSQFKLAMEADVSHQTISNIENGKGWANDTVSKISDALGVPLSELLGETPVGGTQDERDYIKLENMMRTLNKRKKYFAKIIDLYEKKKIGEKSVAQEFIKAYKFDFKKLDKLVK